MKPSLLIVPSLLLASTAFAALRTDDGQGLTRVPPRDPVAESQDDAVFQPEPWRVLLGDQDLDRREESFDRLVRRARRDPAARAFLKDLAATPGELAWTARLALRELRRANTAFGLPEEFGALDPFSMDLDEMLRGLSPGFRFLMPPGGLPAPQPGSPGQLGDGTRESRSISMRKTDGGWRIEVTEVKDGETSTRVFEGATLEEILQDHPELEGELGLSVNGFPDGFRIDLGRPGTLRELFGSSDGLFGWTPRGRELERRLGPSAPLRTDKLGVRVAPVTLQMAERLGIEDGVGLFVDSVVPATLASVFGVEPGSVLLRLEGRALKSAADISAVLEARPDGGSLTLEWVDADGARHEETWKPEATATPDTPEPPAASEL